MMRPAFRTDLGSLMAIGVGAVGGLALTAGLLEDRSHATMHEVHVHRDHGVEVLVTPEIRYKDAVEHYKVMIDGDELMHEHEGEVHKREIVSGMHLDIDVPEVRVMMPQMRMSGPESLETGWNGERVRVKVEARKRRR